MQAGVLAAAEAAFHRVHDMDQKFESMSYLWGSLWESVPYYDTLRTAWSKAVEGLCRGYRHL